MGVVAGRPHQRKIAPPRSFYRKAYGMDSGAVRTRTQPGVFVYGPALGRHPPDHLNVVGRVDELQIRAAVNQRPLAQLKMLGQRQHTAVVLGMLPGFVLKTDRVVK
jgi:hypothetical protein